MPKYLLQVSYTAEGSKGLLKEGGSKRRQAADQAIRSTGGTIESAAPSRELWPVGGGGGGAAVSVPRLSCSRIATGRGVPAGTTLRMIVPRGRAILRNAGSSAARGRRLALIWWAIVVGLPSTRA